MATPVDEIAVIPGYQLTEQLFAGSRTIVYRGIREADQKPVVIKLFNREYPTCSGDLRLIQCFPGKLNQMLMNLLANAIDALDKYNLGQNFAQIQLKPNKNKIKTPLDNNHVKITIADNTQGIIESLQHKIFDHLFTSKGAGKGTELGLAIAPQIITSNHSVKLHFHAVLGVGTEFFIEISM